MKSKLSNDFPTIGSGLFSSFIALINPKMNNTKTTRPTIDATIVKFAGKIKYKILKTMLMRNNPKPCLRW